MVKLFVNSKMKRRFNKTVSAEKNQPSYFISLKNEKLLIQFKKILNSEISIFKIRDAE